MIRSLLLTLALLLCLVPVPATPAAAASGEALPAQPRPERMEDGAYRVKLPLSSLSPVKSTTLVSANDSFSFTLPVPERWEVKSASLTFAYVNSSAVLAKLSRLTVRLSGKVIGQIELRPESPRGRVELPIPGDMLKPGYNKCVFVAAMSASEEFCENPNNPSLWTTLELESATMEITYALKPVPRRLSSITDFLYDPRLFLGEDINVVLPEISENTVRQAILAASGVALRLDYQAARTTVSTAIVPGRDNIVIGDADFVTRLLGQRAPRAEGSTMAILPGETPGKPGQPDPGTATIVLTGTPEGVDKAVRAFSYLSFPFPDTPETSLDQVSDPAPEEFELMKNITRDKEYTLRSLGYQTKTLRAEWGKVPSVEVPFTFPSGLDLTPSSYVTLSLHMNYAPGLRTDSAMTVFINDIFVGGVHFDNSGGGTFLDYRINLPLYAMRKGANILTLRPVLTPLKTAQCEYLQTENLLVTLFDDSTLTFPDIPQWVKLPDLGLFYLDGFPYARWADMRGTTLLIGDKTADTVSAAVNVAAAASQRTGLPPLKLAVSFGPQASGNVIAVGPVDSLPKAIVEGAPFSLLPKGVRPYPQMPRPKPQEEESSAHKAPLWSRYVPFLYEQKAKHSEVGQYLFADIRSGASVSPGKGVVSQYKYPGTAADTVTLFTGATSKDVGQLAVKLWEPAVRSSLSGDLAMIDLLAVEPKVTAVLLGESYYMGSIGTFPKLTLLINTYPWASLGVVAVALLLFSLAAFKALKALRARRG